MLIARRDRNGADSSRFRLLNRSAIGAARSGKTPKERRRSGPSFSSQNFELDERKNKGSPDRIRSRHEVIQSYTLQLSFTPVPNAATNDCRTLCDATALWKRASDARSKARTNAPLSRFSSSK